MQQYRHKFAIAIGASVVVVCIVIVIFLAVRWPFTEQRIIQGLDRMVDSDIRCSRHRLIFLPSPGCDLENVSVVRGSTTLAQVRHLEIRATWPSLLMLQHNLSCVRIDGLRVHLAMPLPPPVDHGRPEHKTAASEIYADGAMLEVERDGTPNDPLRLEFRELLVRNAGAGRKVISPDPTQELGTSR